MAVSALLLQVNSLRTSNAFLASFSSASTALIYSMRTSPMSFLVSSKVLDSERKICRAHLQPKSKTCCISVRRLRQYSQEHCCLRRRRRRRIHRHPRHHRERCHLHHHQCHRPIWSLRRPRPKHRFPSEHRRPKSKTRTRFRRTPCRQQESKVKQSKSKAQQTGAST